MHCDTFRRAAHRLPTVASWSDRQKRCGRGNGKGRRPFGRAISESGQLFVFGTMSRKPNLFLIGAMKSGTTYLRKLLQSHPDIFMCEPDEPSYFVEQRQLRAIWPDMWAHGLWRSEERYLALFAAAGDAAILGEASTNYAKRPLVLGVPERIHAFNPEARFVYLLRDPVERTISHYWHMVRHHAEHRPMLEAIRRDPQFVAVSHYAMQLMPFLERFGPDRIAVVTHERLIADPTATMNMVYAWLGVDTAAADRSGFAQAENVAPDVVSVPRWLGVPRRMRQSPALRTIMPRIPVTIHTALHRLTTTDIRRQSVDVTETVAFLQSLQRRQTDDLMRLLGRTFPEWTTLNGEPGTPSRSAGSSAV